jgi:hypothetical protein
VFCFSADAAKPSYEPVLHYVLCSWRAVMLGIDCTTNNGRAAACGLANGFAYQLNNQGRPMGD